MSNSAVNVELSLSLKDAASLGLKNAVQAAERAASSMSAASERAALRASAAAEKSAERQRSVYQKLSQAREVLGVRSEQAIQREIEQTQAAYARLERAGFSSFAEQAMAADKVRQKVRDLTNEMGRLTASQKAYGALKFGAAGVAGLAAAAYTLKAPAMAAISFDERLAHMSNTAFSERDAAGRKIGMKELEGSINQAVKFGGGTRDQAAHTLDTLLASGALSQAESMSALPQIMKAATAANADPAELANIAIRAKQTFKIKTEELPNVLNMALAAGQAGGFELKDMSKWLPQQMAAATLSGLGGRNGFAKLAALNQAAAITAGSKDEAGNNVVNLLTKINSSDTAKDAKNLGIDLPKYLQQKRANGIDSVDAFAELVQGSVNKREDYKALQLKLKSAKNDDDKRATLESMATIAEGAGIGKIIQDRQALMALLGVMNNPDYLRSTLAKIKANDVSSGGAIDAGFDVVSNTTAYKVRAVEQTKDIAQKTGMDQLTPAIGRVADAFGDLANKHPLLVGATTLAATALGALAGAAGLATVAMGKGEAGGALGKAAATLGASKGAQFALKAGKVASLGGIASMAGGYALEKTFGEESAVSRYGSSALSGAALGATVGSFVPVVGTLVGGALGGGLGLIYEGIKDALKPPAPTEAPKMNADIKVTVSDERVRVTNMWQESVGMNLNMTTNTGNVFSGAPK